MNPITGPFSKTETGLGPPDYFGNRPKWYQWDKTWYRQRRPYNLPLTYDSTRKNVLSLNDSKGYYTSDVSTQGVGYVPQYVLDNAWNKVYAKFREACYQSTSVAVDLAERRQSIDMIVKRSTQLIRFTKAIRRLRFGDAARALGLTELPRNLKNRKGLKAAASNWLEFHFGWEPLVKDIYDACEIISKPIPNLTVKARASTVDHYTVPWDGSGDPRVSSVYSTIVKFHVQSEIKIDNPNLALATQMGLTNPLSVAWELVPFSFVVDWFVNVGDFLQSVTDFAGFTLVNPQRSRVVICNENRSIVYLSDNNRLVTTQTRYVQSIRRTGVPPGPVLRVRPLKPFSAIRGITSISLLLQRLPK